MSQSKGDFVAVTDIAAAIGLLSRLPVRLESEKAHTRGARAAWAWPLAGALIGGLGAAAASLALWLGLGPALAAALALVCLVVVTGAMHEDGLADCADGFWGGWDRGRRLEIMKDSRIGAYGVLALGLSLILRWQGIAAIVEHGAAWPGLIAVGAMSRAPMVAMMAAMPPVREAGLSRAVGQPSGGTVGLALVLAAGLSVIALGLTGLTVIACVALLATGWAALCRAKIGGQTGDTLGGMQQVSEIAALLALAASLPRG